MTDFNYEEWIAQDAACMRAMFLASLERRLLDIVTERTNGEAELNRHHAERWIKTKDFERLCVSAGLSPEYMQRKLPEALGRFASRSRRTSIPHLGQSRAA